MSGYVLAHKDTKMYIKEVDTANQKLEYTNDINEAKLYETEWFAQTELEYLIFHFENERNILQNMNVVYKRNNNNGQSIVNSIEEDPIEGDVGEDVGGDQIALTFNVDAEQRPW